MTAIAEQVRRDVSPIWQTYAAIYPYAGDVKLLGPDTWRVYVQDDSGGDPRAGTALGMHDIVDGRRIPTGWVFAKYLKSWNIPWTRILSHEIVEMLVDPQVNLFVLRRHADAPEMWYREACDPVEGDQYLINQIPVANFVFPNFFVLDSLGQYDQMRLVTHPFEVRPGGYQSVLRLEPHELVPRDIYGAMCPDWQKTIRPGSRRAARQEILRCRS